MSHVTQTELQQLVGHDAGRIAEAEETVICEDRVQTHGPRVQQAFVAQIAERGVAVHNLDLLTNENLAQQWKRAEDGRESGRAVNHPMREMVDLDTVRQIAYATAARIVVGMCDDDDIMATVDEFLPLGLVG